MSQQDTSPLAIQTFTLKDAVQRITSILEITDQLSEKDLLKYGAQGKLEICTRLSSNPPENYRFPMIFGHRILEIKWIEEKFLHKKFKLQQNLWMSSKTYEERLFHPSSIRIYNPPFRAIWDFRWLHRDFRYLNFQSAAFDLLIRINKNYLDYLSHSNTQDPDPFVFKEFYLCKSHSLWVQNDELTESEELKAFIHQDISSEHIPAGYKNGRFLKGLSICCALPETIEQPIEIKNPPLLITQSALDDFVSFLRKKHTILIKPVNRTNAQQENILLLLEFLANSLKGNAENAEDNIFFDEKINQWVSKKRPKNKQPNPPIIFFNEKENQWWIEQRRNPSVKTMVRELIEIGRTNISGKTIELKDIRGFTPDSFEKNWEDLTGNRNIEYIKLEKSSEIKNHFILKTASRKKSS